MDADQVARIPPADLQRLVRNSLSLGRRVGRGYDPDTDSDALLGLTKALRDYDPGKGASLDTFAMIRVRGEVLDGIRDRSPIGRCEYKRLLDANVSVDALDDEIRQHSPVSFDHLVEVNRRWDVADEGEGVGQAVADHATRQRTDALWALIDLTARQPRFAEMMRALFVEGLTMAQVGERYGVTESRVSQIIKRVIDDVREVLGVQVEDKVHWRRAIVLPTQRSGLSSEPVPVMVAAV